MPNAVQTDEDDEDSTAVLVKPSTPVAKIYNVPGCEACAKGSIFLAAVRLKNGVQVKELKSLNVQDDGLIDASSVDSITVCAYVDDIFDKRQLDMIEAAFESHAVDSYLDDKERKKLGMGEYEEYYYLRGEIDPAERMTAIMKNIVANKGTFRPTKADLGL